MKIITHPAQDTILLVLVVNAYAFSGVLLPYGSLRLWPLDSIDYIDDIHAICSLLRMQLITLITLITLMPLMTREKSAITADGSPTVTLVTPEGTFGTIYPTLLFNSGKSSSSSW